MKCFYLIAALLLVFIAEVHSYNILMTTMNSRSHKIFFDAVAEQLIKRGHQVTLITSVKDDAQPAKASLKNVHVNYEEAGPDDQVPDNSQRLTIEMDYYSRVTHEMTRKCESLYANPFVQELVQKRQPKYDAVIVDAIFNEFALALADHLKVPAMLVSPTVLYPHTAWFLSIPHFSSFIPSPLVTYPGRMDYNGRLHNTWVVFRLLHALYFHAFTAVDAVVRGSIPTAPSTFDMLGNVSFLFTNTNPVIGLSVPTAPYFVEVGGLQCRPAKPLPQDLEGFFKNSKESAAGIVYVSIDGRLQTKARVKFLKALSGLPQLVIWRYDDNVAATELPKNVKLVKSAPQQDILGHQAVKLFITDGSNVDIHDAIYHGRPILGVPFTTQQLQNVGIAVIRGIGEIIDLEKFSVKGMLGTIQKILGNKSYADNVQRMSKLLKDSPEEPSRRLTFWIEYVIRNSGAPHLRTEADHLASYEYFLVDTYGSVVAIFAGFILLIVILIVTLTPLLGRPYKGIKKTKVK